MTYELLVSGQSTSTSLPVWTVLIPVVVFVVGFIWGEISHSEEELAKQDGGPTGWWTY